MRRLSSAIAAAAWVAAAAPGQYCPDLKQVVVGRLPNVTHRFFDLKGTRLDLTKSVRFGASVLKSTSPDDWDRGYFRIVSATQLHVYPPQGLAAATYSVTATGATCSGASVSVTIFKPTLRYTRSNATIRAGKVQTIRACKGDMPDSSVGVLGVSPVKKGSIVKGIITLGIGDRFTMLVFLPIALPFDRKTAVATLRFPVPQALRGSLHFQTVVIDLKKPGVRPFRTTDVHTTLYR